jgi:hypothetical protein
MVPSEPASACAPVVIEPIHHGVYGYRPRRRSADRRRRQVAISGQIKIG